MRKTILAALTLFAASAFTTNAAPDLTKILQGLGNGKTNSEQTTAAPEQSAEKNGTSGLSGLLEGAQSIGNKLGILPSKTVTIDYLKGVWEYKKPAVAFQSENLLAKAGGVAASAKVESELAPYYKKVGLDKTVLTVNADSTFTMKLAYGQLTGSISTNPDGKSLSFKFKVLGVSLSAMNAYVNAETNNQMSITFDVSKLLLLVEKISAFSGQTSLKTLSTLLKQYDGMTAGFYLHKTADDPAKQ